MFTEAHTAPLDANLHTGERLGVSTPIPVDYYPLSLQPTDMPNAQPRMETILADGRRCLWKGYMYLAVGSGAGDTIRRYSEAARGNQSSGFL